MVGRGRETAWTSGGIAPALATRAVAGVAGTIVMTVFQKFVKMPLTRRRESYEPANMVHRLTSFCPGRKEDRRRLNHAAHVAVGAGWGAAHGVIDTKTKLRGQPAVAALFGILWPADVLGVAALGVHEPPCRWTPTETAVDFVDESVLAQETGMIFDLAAGPARTDGRSPSERKLRRLTAPDEGGAAAELRKSRRTSFLGLPGRRSTGARTPS